MDINYKADFDILIDAAIQIGKMMQGVKVEKSPVQFHLAEGLGKKIVNHTLSARHLIQGYQLKLLSSNYEPKIDIASIAVLTRAAMETYLTLNHVFVAKECDTTRELRFLSWDLAGYIERADFTAKDPEHIKLKEKEVKEANRRILELEKLVAYQELNSKKKKQIIRGNWRANASWHDLAIESGFNSDYFSQQYKYLCSYAHSGRLSVIQVQQNDTFKIQQDMADSFMGTLMMILAKNMIDYIKIFPNLELVKQNRDLYSIIFLWKEIAERIDPNKKD
jgi:hypothetical protein